MSQGRNRVPMVTSSMMQHWLDRGRGAGHGKDYVPWHTTENFDSFGHSVKGICSLTGRKRYCFGDVEEAMRLALERRSDVEEVQENFPLLPTALTQKICMRLGWRHPVFTGPDRVLIPYTTDALVFRTSSPRRIAIGCTTRSHLFNAAKCRSILVQSVFWSLWNVPFFACTELELNADVLTSLRFLSPDPKVETPQSRDPAVIAEFRRRACESSWRAPLIEVVRRISAEMKIESTVGLSILKGLLWRGDLECDLRKGLSDQTRFAVVVRT
jgi:hypothetical protein